ncbi:MAG: alpha/beta hydrolase [Hellea sp.]|nr:alpha/beta hydrolase [Hellea sp.]
MSDTLSYLDAPPHLSGSPEKIAYKMSSGQGPAIIWCGGLKSDIEGSKAIHLHKWANSHSQTFIRFDYFGHGESSGLYGEGTISRWGQDVVTVMDRLAPEGDILLVGSSMGGWASMLAARARPERVKALLLIAPAPDFTEKLMWANWPANIRQTIMTEGVYFAPSDYDEPYEYRRALIEDGRDHQLLDEPFKFEGPVRILQGGKDDVVPPEYSKQLINIITSQDMSYTLVKSGDHSLSSPPDLYRLELTLSELCQTLSQ